MPFEYQDESEQWLTEVLANHYEEARERALSLIGSGRVSEDGCILTDTATPKKTRFRGRQLFAYRFIHCIATRTPASTTDYVRHRCNNRWCINPDHLELGSHIDNVLDEREFRANGVDFGLL